jgi:hypothetical protein
VEKRASVSVFLPTSEKIFALVYLLILWVTVNGAVRSPALGVDRAFRDPLAVLVGEFFD